MPYISGENVICLSKSGKVYILPASQQQLLDGPKPQESSWLPFWSESSSVSYTTLSLPEKITHLTAGDDHLVLLSKSGDIFTAATTSDGNAFGQLGLETAPEAPLFHAYKLSLPEKVRAVAAGERHSVALTERGDVYSWGSNAQGQLLQQYSDNNFLTPVPTRLALVKLMPGVETVSAVYAGGANSFLVTRAGNGDVEVWASGSGMWGQLGNGVWNQVQHRPVRVKVIRGLAEWDEAKDEKRNIGIRYLSVGENHVAAVLDNDVSGGIGGQDVYVWGCGEAYQLGHGKVHSRCGVSG
jgi:alpha-tubulin suppressor-like RCC1 family protein